MVKKNETVGCIGENLFLKTILKAKIPIQDLRKEYVLINNRLIYTHPFDFVVNGKNVEIKTCTIKNNSFSWSWFGSNVDFIDYVVCIAINTNKQFKFFIVLDKNFIINHRSFSRKLDFPELKTLNKKKLIKIFKEQFTNNPQETRSLLTGGGTSKTLNYKRKTDI